MAKWKETLEPYVKVIESVKTVASNPTAGQDMIVAAVIISDSGPASPTLITSQKEFLKTYAAEDLTQDYTDSLNDLYTSDPGSPLASTMWLNAYRLAGSTNLLVCRASKAKDLIYAKPLSKSDQNAYVLKNTEVLKKVPSFKFVLDKTTAGYTDGWAISIADTGIIGNRVTDDGPIYDYKVDTLPELVDQLNDTTKFFSPEYHFYTDAKCTDEFLVEGDDIADKKDDIVAVLFNEVYLGADFLDTDVPLEDFKGTPIEGTTDEEADGKNDYQVNGATGTTVEIKGMCYILAVDPDFQTFSATGNNAIVDLNAKAYSGFTPVDYYATNLYNSRSDLQVRVRRFNHNAVTTKVTSDAAGAAPESPYIVSGKVLDKYTASGTKTPADSILHYDFYEFAIMDPDISDSWQLFNVGNIGGRGDITVADLNDNLSMLHLTLPDNLLDLDINYYGYNADNYGWVKTSSELILGANKAAGSFTLNNKNLLPEIKYKKNGTLLSPDKDKIYYVLTDKKYTIKTWTPPVAGGESLDFGDDDEGSWSDAISFEISEAGLSSIENFKGILGSFDSSTKNAGVYAVLNDDKCGYEAWQVKSKGEEEINISLSLKRNDSLGQKLTSILDVSDNDLMQAWDRIEEDERYVVEGMTDLGNTYSILQNYMANIAVNSNYFYAVSTINSTNYMTIANKKSKITKDTSKLYFLAPWDYDDGSVGYLFNASPSVLYWECVSRNRTNNNQFAPAFGQTTGIITPVNLTTDFKRTERQLLLTKKVNTIFHDVNIERIYVNDNYTAQSSDDIRKEENIERAIIHISKNMPTLLNQFKGRINSSKTRQAVVDVISYWFKSHMIPASGGLIDDYRITCDDELNPAEEQRANRLNVKVQTRFLNSVKYISVAVVYYKFIKLLERVIDSNQHPMANMGSTTKG